MKKIFLGMLAIALMSSPAFAADGGKKKQKSKAKIECKKDNCCDPKCCDPKCCDIKSCEPKQGEPPTCSKNAQCSSTASCTGNK